MNNRKSTKRALIFSCLSLLLCVSMLVGSTFAWFTDVATTSVNSIQSGTLDVALEMSYDGGTTWENAEGKTLDFIKAPGAENEPILWEPGCTYELPMLRVVNKGNLALKYSLTITGIQGSAKLNEAIEWTINGEEMTAADLQTESYLLPLETGKGFTIVGHMKETAGNEYQGLTIEGIAVTVLASQKDYENDSTDNTYDEDAQLYSEDADGNIVIDNAAALIGFANAVNKGGLTFEGKTVYLTNDIDLGGMTWTPIGQTQATEFKGTFDGREHTISNFVVNSLDQTDKNYATGLFGWLENHGDGIVIKNVTLDKVSMVSYNYTGAIVGHTNGDVTVENCHVTNATLTVMPQKFDDGSYDLGDKVGGIVGFSDTGITIKGCSVKDSTIKAYRDMGGIVGISGGLLTDNTVDGLTMIQDYTNGNEGVKTTVNDICGRDNGLNAACANNTSANVTREFILTPGVDVAAVLAYANRAGDVVRFTEGLYTGVNNAVVADGVTLVGEANAVIEVPSLDDPDGRNGGAVATYIVQLGSNTKMSGLTFKTKAGVNYGMGEDWRHEVIGLTGDTVTVEDCVFDLTGSQYNALCIERKGTNITLKNCEVAGGYKAISVGDSVQSGGNVTIENCEISDVTYGIHLNASTHDLIVKDSQISGWVTIWGKADGTDTGNVSFTNCSFTSEEAGAKSYFSLYRGAKFVDCVIGSGMGLNIGVSGSEVINVEFTNTQWVGTTVLEKVTGDKNFAKDFSATIDGVTYNYSKADKNWTQK